MLTNDGCLVVMLAVMLLVLGLVLLIASVKQCCP